MSVSIIFENPWPLFALVLALALVAYFFARQKQDAKLVLLAMLLFVLLPVPFLVDWLVVTESEQVVVRLEELRSAFAERRAQVLVDSIDPSFKAANFDHAQMTEAIRRESAAFEADSIRLNAIKVEADKTTAKADFVAVLAGKYRGHAINWYPMRLRVHFNRAKEQWKINKIERFDAKSPNTEIPLLSQ